MTPETEAKTKDCCKCGKFARFYLLTTDHKKMCFNCATSGIFHKPPTEQSNHQPSLSRTQKRQQSSQKHQRTVEYETSVKTAIMDDAVLRQLNEDILALHQKNFDKLVRNGTICLDDTCEYIEVDGKDIKFEGEFTL